MQPETGFRRQRGVYRQVSKGENIATDVLLKVCKALDCDIADIMEIELEKKED